MKNSKKFSGGGYVIGELFESYNGNFDIQKSHINGKGEYVITSGLNNNGILGKSDIKAKIFSENTITIDMFGNSFFRNYKYKMVTHARVFSLSTKFNLSENIGLFIVSMLSYLNLKFGYSNMCTWEKIKKETIHLPTKNGEIDFEFMEAFIAELEAHRIAELEAYLEVTGLKNYNLTNTDKYILSNIDNIEFK